MENPKIIVDTSIWLMACARKTKGDKMSKIDRQLNEASKSQNQKKYRGFLTRVLTNYQVVVPKIVLEELKNIAQKGRSERFKADNSEDIAHQYNKEDLEVIIQAMEGRTTDALPTKDDLLQQAAIWERIRLMPDHTKRWQTKFQPTQNRVHAAAEKAKLIDDLEEPWIKAYHTLQAKQKRFEREYTPALSKDIEKWQRELTKSWPDLIPDYEILLVSKATQAPVVSRDRDFSLMWLASPTLKNQPHLQPRTLITVDDTRDPETSLQTLTDRLRENLTSQPAL